MANIFYYSSMEPNAIYSAADQYLNRVGTDGDPTDQLPKETRREEPILEQSAPPECYYQQPQSQPAFHASPPTQAQAPTQVPTSPVATSLFGATPRISSKAEVAKQRNLLFQDIAVTVSEVINPGNFYLVLQDQENEYETLKQALKNFYENNDFVLPIEVEQYYAAKLEGTEDWGRVKVVNYVNNFCGCLFIDYGVTFYIADNKLFLLDDQFKKLPPRAFKAGLLGITTAMWPYAISTEFKKMVLGKRLVAFVQTVDNNVFKCILTNGINVNEEISKMLGADRSLSF